MDSDNFEMARNFFLDGLKYLHNQEFQDAEFSFLKSLDLVPNRASTLINLASTQIKLNKLVEAEKNLQIVAAIDKESIDLWLNLGLLSLAKNHLSEAINYFLKCIEIDSLNISAQKLLAQTYDQRQEFDQAITCFKKILELSSSDIDALINLGAILNDLKRYNESVQYSQSAIQIDQNSVNGYVNLGVALHGLGNFDLAIQNYTKALELNFSDPEIWLNKGVTFYSLKLYDEALTHYDKALSLKLDYAEAWSNKGLTLHELKRFDESIAHYDKALSLKPDYAEGWSNKGNTLHELKRYDEAITHYDKALSLKPDIDWIAGYLLHTKMKICSWSGLAESMENISKKIGANEKVANPFPLLALNDDVLLHKKSSEIFIQSKYPFNSALGPILKRPQSQKIRVGCFSADFHNHATGYLMAELFELHDKSQFELVGLSFGPIVNDEMRQRLLKSFDQFIEVGGKSDVEVAKLSRDLNIDIAVDLKGFTQDARTGIFAHRAAPIQVSYLGYPGTIGADYIDYIIADKTLIPPLSQEFYSEKVVYLPNSYQVNDRKREIAERKFTKAELGLPETGIVFCCFNNNFKILPATFEGWIQILKAVEGSVLWLFQDNSWAAENLKREAEKRGIAADRLVFAERFSLPEHLARHRQADLFLDTFPYNAHTTTSDALWSGLPVLTLMGQSFASRVAASLLNAIGLPELIASTQEEYEALAIELALNPNKLHDVKLRLARNRLTTTLFDTPLFTKNLETAYIKMYERYHADLEPEHITIT